MSAKELKAGEWLSVALDAGEHLRIEALAEGQAVELIAHMASDPRERLSTTLSTLVEYANTPREGLRLWTQNYEPMLRVVALSESRHDMGLEACTPFVSHEIAGVEDGHSCWANFREAIDALGLHPKWIPYPLGIFRQAGFRNGKFQLLPAASTAGDFIEFAAEAPVTVVASACPVSAPAGGREMATVKLDWGEHD